jgi:hypothetical protein
LQRYISRITNYVSVLGEASQPRSPGVATEPRRANLPADRSARRIAFDHDCRVCPHRLPEAADLDVRAADTPCEETERGTMLNVVLGLEKPVDVCAIPGNPRIIQETSRSSR